jgi:hypothetical protein
MQNLAEAIRSGPGACAWNDGHASVLTTERYLGRKQNPEEPVNDRFGCLFSASVGSR